MAIDFFGDSPRVMSREYSPLSFLASFLCSCWDVSGLEMKTDPRNDCLYHQYYHIRQKTSSVVQLPNHEPCISDERHAER